LINLPKERIAVLRLSFEIDRIDKMNPYSDHQSPNKSELLELGLPIVNRIAHYLRGRVPDHVSIEDMIQIGTIGLMEAEAAFDHNTGVKFVDFAKQRVRGAILDEVRKQSTISRLAIKNRQAHAEAEKKLQQSLGREPRNSETALELGITLAEYERQRIHAERFLIDNHFQGTAELDELVSENEGNPFNNISDDDSINFVKSAISKLPRRERLIINLYYVEEMNMREISEIIGVNESRISQLLKEIVLNLRTKLVTE
jgi:RNA polymerase sigma factor for flagellar operon FliA